MLLLSLNPRTMSVSELGWFLIKSNQISLRFLHHGSFCASPFKILNSRFVESMRPDQWLGLVLVGEKGQE